VNRRNAKIRFLSLFVLAFICLNAGGSVCLAYCRGYAKVEAKADRCPLERAGHHCNKAKNSGPAGPAYIEPDSGSMDCCTLPITFITATLEKRHGVIEPVATASVELPRIPATVWRATDVKPGFAIYISYFPDLRSLHIRNRLFRI
jgi:hypothetical protein